jgi:hypothetical protein
LGKQFDQAMKTLGNVMGEDDEIAGSFNFKDLDIVYEMGSSTGSLLYKIMKDNDHLIGGLFDLPAVIPRIKV